MENKPNNEETSTPLLKADCLQDFPKADTRSSSNTSRDSFVMNNPSGSSICNAVINDDEESLLSSNSFERETDPDMLYLQATVLFEDAINYRSIHHKMDKFSIRLYRWFYSLHVQWSLKIATYILLLLAFFEYPSSLTWSSDPRLHHKRYELPFGLTAGIELMCLLIIFTSLIIQSYLTSDVPKLKAFPSKHPWITGGYIVIILSLVDLLISSIYGNENYDFRVRRLLRPYFLAVNSTMLKKTLKCIKNTLPEIGSVLTLLLLHIYFFMMLGMLMFPQVEKKLHSNYELNNTEWKLYFSTLDRAFTSLLVLLTTANNPDVMIPAYSQNRLYALYFIVFSFIGTFLMFNLVTAVVYNQFRGYFQNSMQSSYFRRCVAASAVFKILLRLKNGPDENLQLHSESHSGEDEEFVESYAIRKVSNLAMISKKQRSRINDNLQQISLDENLINHIQFKILLAKVDVGVQENDINNENTQDPENNTITTQVKEVIRHQYFDMVGNMVVFINAVFVTVEIAIHYEQAFHDVRSRLNIINYIFVCYYAVEQTLKVWAHGLKYFKKLSFVYDGVLTITLIIMEIVQTVRFAHNSSILSSGISLWDCARIVNILILLRLLRIIPNIKPMAVVTSVLLEIVHNLASFVGVLVIIYYTFAIVGMMAFKHSTDPPYLNIVSLYIIITLDSMQYSSINQYRDTASMPTSGNSSIFTPIQPPQYECGTYEQLNYWANNFNDFAASLVVLWDVMVVNNWQVFLHVYSERVSPWAQLYFILWWVVAVIITINLFIALILDHFIAKLDSPQCVQSDAVMRMGRRGTVHALFHNQIHEPTHQEIVTELEKHPSIRNYFAESQ